MGTETEGKDRGKPLSTDEAALLASRVADLAGAGLAIPDGLRCLAAEMPGRRLSRAALDLADRVERGESLADAVEAKGRTLPPHVRELLVSAVRSGRMGPVLGEFITHGRVGDDLRRALMVSLLYPLLILVGLGAIMALLYGFVVPQFHRIFDDFGIQPPMITLAVLEVARLVGGGGLSQFLMLLGGLAILFAAWRLFLDASSRRWVVCRVPLIGPIFRWTSLAEFCHYAGVLIDAEIPLERAVSLAGDATGDASLSVSSHRAAQEIVGGRSLADALATAPAFPRGVAYFLDWAEKRHALSETLHTLGDLFAAEARGRASLVAVVVAVVVVVFVIWAVGITVVGLFLPLIQLIHRLSG